MKSTPRYLLLLLSPFLATAFLKAEEKKRIDEEYSNYSWEDEDEEWKDSSDNQQDEEEEIKPQKRKRRSMLTRKRSKRKALSITSLFLLLILILGYLLNKESNNKPIKSDSKKKKVTERNEEQKEPKQKNEGIKDDIKYPLLDFIVLPDDVTGGATKPYLVVRFRGNDKETKAKELFNALSLPLAPNSGISYKFGLECVHKTEKEAYGKEESKSAEDPRDCVRVFCQKHAKDDTDHTAKIDGKTRSPGGTIGENLQRIQHEVIEISNKYGIREGMYERLNEYYLARTSLGKDLLITMFPMLEGTDKLLEWLENKNSNPKPLHKDIFTPPTTRENH